MPTRTEPIAPKRRRPAHVPPQTSSLVERRCVAYDLASAARGRRAETNASAVELLRVCRLERVPLTMTSGTGLVSCLPVLTAYAGEHVCAQMRSRAHEVSARERAHRQNVHASMRAHYRKHAYELTHKYISKE